MGEKREGWDVLIDITQQEDLWLRVSGSHMF